ncbi:hypothetical protein HELRODRAFT_174401 [Helobdella robusta]|uniref:Large ribosomal subunit protein bL32m n=1 Tax=Helobdella robusta TaxID=6412 RepID=T1F830_HELRO|nr:hypothetical protein HELRODRAFT_174401 [Helobdella robusta]ESO02926.1 hypothetical protein HELRODRAFT_174401 [Helobdella robusta]
MVAALLCLNIEHYHTRNVSALQQQCKYASALAVSIANTGILSKSGFPSISEILDGILFAAVPKNRRSREKRAKRRFGCHKVREYMTPKTNIVVCLNCGHYHESHTLCGHCYDKVKNQTPSNRENLL